MVETKHYTYGITWWSEDKEYVARCAEFPSLSYLSDNPTDALTNMVNLVEEVVADMKANREPIPVPLAEKEYSGSFQISIQPEKHRRLAIKAAQQGISLNSYISSKLLEDEFIRSIN